MRECSSCHLEYGDDARFCPMCGRALTDEVPATFLSTWGPWFASRFAFFLGIVFLLGTFHFFVGGRGMHGRHHGRHAEWVAFSDRGPEGMEGRHRMHSMRINRRGDVWVGRRGADGGLPPEFMEGVESGDAPFRERRR